MLSIDYFNDKYIQKPDLKFENEERLFKQIYEMSPNIVRSWISHAIPTLESVNMIREIINKKTVLEVGAGKAFWAKLLAPYSETYIATDKCKIKNAYYPVLQINGEKACKLIKADVLIIIWPPYDDMAYNCVKNFKGSTLIYIGEDRNGFTANDQFFDYLKVNYRMVMRINIPTIFGHFDRVNVFSHN